MNFWKSSPPSVSQAFRRKIKNNITKLVILFSLININFLRNNPECSGFKRNLGQSKGNRMTKSGILFFVLRLKALSALLFSIFFMACENKAPVIKNNTEDRTLIARDVKEIKYIDEGAVVPNPRIREISILLQDSANAHLNYLTYTQNQGNDTTKKDIKVTQERVELFYDNMIKLADLPDGMEIIPGKVPCVGKKSINVSIIFNTGDTSRFKISGGALCDNDVIPEWKLIDSLTSVIYTESLVKQ
jgi:hypothetical protein